VVVSDVVSDVAIEVEAEAVVVDVVVHARKTIKNGYWLSMSIYIICFLIHNIFM